MIKWGMLAAQALMKLPKEATIAPTIETDLQLNLLAKAPAIGPEIRRYLTIVDGYVIADNQPDPSVKPIRIDTIQELRKLLPWKDSSKSTKITPNE